MVGVSDLWWGEGTFGGGGEEPLVVGGRDLFHSIKSPHRTVRRRNGRFSHPVTTVASEHNTGTTIFMQRALLPSHFIACL